MAVRFAPAAPLNAAALLPDELVQQQLAIEPDDKAALVAVQRATALGWVERHAGVSLESRPWLISYDGFADELVIPIGPVSAITEITYLDADGISRTAAGLWRLAGDRIVPLPAQRWPVPLPGPATVSALVIAGRGSVSDEAPALLTAALMLLVHLWNDGSLDAVPAAVISLCEPYRQPVIA